MRKICFVFVLLFSFYSLVNAETDILKKEKEVAQKDFGSVWTNLNREVFTFDDYYLIYDIENGSYYWTTYDREWQEIATKEMSRQNIGIDKSNFYYVLSGNHATKEKESIYYTIEKYNKNFEADLLEIEYISQKITVKFKDYDWNLEEYKEIEEVVYCFLKFEDMVYTSDGSIHLLVTEKYEDLEGEMHLNDYKVITINNEFDSYSFSSISEDEIKARFPKYYYSGIVYSDDCVYVYTEDDNVLVSGDKLIYYNNHNKKFEITNDNYDRFLSAKVYNELIIAIAYNAYSDENEDVPITLRSTDILFYDLDGNLIGDFKDNLYVYDFELIDDKIVLANVYVDGICTIVDGLYYSYNTNCNATLLNEVYGLEEKFLGMAMNNKNEGIANPETTFGVGDVVNFIFLVSIIITSSLLIKSKTKRI